MISLLNEKNWYDRTELLLGSENFSKLKDYSICIVGVGGVGGACAEALCRCGVGELILIDHDTVDITNINRQLIATHQTVGRAKVTVLKERLLSINPVCNIIPLVEFYSEKNKHILFDLNPDFIVDAIDTVSAKISLAMECSSCGTPLISSMGTGNRLDPTKFKIGSIKDTADSECGCGLARVMRQELRKRGIIDLPVLYSTEYPKNVISDSSNGRHSPASISFCPPVAGYIIASFVVNKILFERDY